MIPALVLTAGLATRLRPLSLVRAKAAMPVAGDALVRRILRQLQAAGIRDVVLNLHHLPYTITREVGDGTDLGLQVRYSWEVPVLGSGGGPRQALPLLGEPTFLIVNGDTLTDVDVAPLVDEHRRTGAVVTMAVVPNTQPDKYGSVLVDEDGVVNGFSARGTAVLSAEARSAKAEPFHFIGVQVAEGAAFASVAPGQVAESVAQVYPMLIETQPGSVRAYMADATFFDIGRPDDYLQTALRMAARNGGALHGARTRIDPTARVEDSVLWDDVVVGAGASLHGCVVADGVRVPERSAWTRMMVRRVEGQLAPHEERIGDLGVTPIAERER
jgi:mannose-1-phosphate guanylyltransferase